MVGDGEPVGLVAHPLQQVEALAGARQHHRVPLAGAPHLLEPLGQTDQRDVGDTQPVQRPLRRGDLRWPPVDHHQVGRVGEAARPAGLGVDAGRAGAGVGRLGDGRLLVDVPAEPSGEHLVHPRGVVLPVGAAHGEPAVLALARQPVLEDHHRRDDLGALQVGDVVALDPQRRVGQLEHVLDLVQRLGAGGEVAAATGLVQRERVLGIALDRLEQGPLVTPPGHPKVDVGAAQPAEPLGHLVGVERQLRHQHLARDGLGRRAVDLQQQAFDQVGRADVLDLLDHPTALAAHPAAAHVEHLDGGLELVLGQREHVGVGRVGQDDDALLQRPLQCPDVVAQPGRPLEVQVGRGLAHLALETAGEPPGVAGHEVAELSGQGPVLVGSDAADAGRRALVDVAEQTGPADLLGAAEHPVAAGADGEHAQQQVDGLADRPGVAVGAEVPGALALVTAHHLHPRDVVAHRHREVGVGLVVAVLDVEPRVELLDPGVLELQGLDLGAHHGPLDAGRRGDHRLGPRVQRGQVLEVRGQPRAQALGLAHVDHPALGVAEPVDPGAYRDLARGGSVGRRVCHSPSLRAGCDSPDRPPGGRASRHTDWAIAADRALPCGCRVLPVIAAVRVAAG